MHVMKNVFKRGLFTGIIVTIWLFGAYAIVTALPLNIPKPTLRTLTGLLGLVILFLGVLSGMKAARSAIPAEQFNFYTAFKSGFIVAFMVAIVVAFSALIYLKFINPNMPEDMVREAEASLKASHAKADEISSRLIAVRKEFSIQGQLIAALIVQTVAGSIFS